MIDVARLKGADRTATDSNVHHFPGDKVDDPKGHISGAGPTTMVYRNTCIQARPSSATSADGENAVPPGLRSDKRAA